MARVTTQLIDGNGVYFSRLAAGGPYVFLASPAVDESGRVAAEAIVKPPYHDSPSAQIRAQTTYIWQRYKEGLESLGTSIENVTQVEQYIQRKVHADGYLETSRGPGFMERKRPGSALIATGDFMPQGCVVNPTAIAIIPGDGITRELLAGPGRQDPGKRAEFGEAYAEEPVYNELVTAGPYVFTVGDWSGDYETGIHPDARTDDWIWWGSEIRSEANYILPMLGARLEVAGTTLENVVHATTFLIDITDQYEFDLVWRRFFPTDPPARTVFPVRGLGTPRAEDARTHASNAMKMESMCQSIRPGFGIEKEVISTGTPPLSHESEAIRARPLLWISGQLAGDPNGLLTDPDTSSQLAYIFKRLADICEAGGTNVHNLLRLRAYVTEPRDSFAVYAALKDAVPSDPPCVAITGVPGSLQVPGCTVVVDAVAYVPD